MNGVSGDVSLGANFVSYEALGNKLTMAYCPVFDDQNIHSQASGTNAFGDNRLKESAKMVFLDFGKTSGVSGQAFASPSIFQQIGSFAGNIGKAAAGFPSS